MSVVDVDEILENQLNSNSLSISYDVYSQLFDSIPTLGDENAKLRELVRDMWENGMCECDERGACAECRYHFPDRMRELGVGV